LRVRAGFRGEGEVDAAAQQAVHQGGGVAGLDGDGVFGELILWQGTQDRLYSRLFQS
jgi:hypothetical protein